MTITARFLPKYPKRIQVADGLTKTEANGVVTLGFDYVNSEFGAELQQAVDTSAANATATAADRIATGEDKAAAEAAQVAAESARDVALGSVAIFPTMTLAEASTPVAASAFIQLQGHTTPGIGGALYRKVDSQPSHPGKFSITLSDATTVVWYEISEAKLNPLMFGGVRDQAGVDSWQAFKDCLDTIAAQAVSAAVRYGAPLYLPAGQYEISQPIVINTPGVHIVGEGSVTSVIKAQAGMVGSYVVTHTPVDTTATMVGAGMVGVGIDCDHVSINGYLGEMVYDNIIYDDVRISNIHANAIGFTLQPKAGHILDLCETIDIRSLFVAKYDVKGTVPAVFINTCNEINIWSSKAWNGFGNLNTDNIGIQAPWFIQDCNALTMVGCSTANANIGIKVYCQNKPQTQISIINQTFENIVGTMLAVDSSDVTTKKVFDLAVVNPRHESPATGGYSLNGVTRAYVEAGPQPVGLSSSTTLTTVLADDLSQVSDLGTNNMLRSRKNDNSPWEGFGHNINVKPGGFTLLQTQSPGSGETSLIIGILPTDSAFATKKILVGPQDSAGTGLRSLVVEN